MLGLYAELYALALHIYVHGDPGNNVGPRDPQLGHLLYKRPVETSERSIMEKTVFSFVGKRISRRRQDQWKLTPMVRQVLVVGNSVDGMVASRQIKPSIPAADRLIQEASCSTLPHNAPCL